MKLKTIFAFLILGLCWSSLGWGQATFAPIISSKTLVFVHLDCRQLDIDTIKTKLNTAADKMYAGLGFDIRSLGAINRESVKVVDGYVEPWRSTFEVFTKEFGITEFAVVVDADLLRKDVACLIAVPWKGRRAETMAKFKELLKEYIGPFGDSPVFINDTLLIVVVPMSSFSALPSLMEVVVPTTVFTGESDFGDSTKTIHPNNSVSGDFDLQSFAKAAGIPLPPGVTPETITRMPPEMFARISPEALAKITPEMVASMPPELLAKMPPEIRAKKPPVATVPPTVLPTVLPTVPPTAPHDLPDRMPAGLQPGMVPPATPIPQPLTPAASQEYIRTVMDFLKKVPKPTQNSPIVSATKEVVHCEIKVVLTMPTDVKELLKEFPLEMFLPKEVTEMITLGVEKISWFATGFSFDKPRYRMVVGMKSASDARQMRNVLEGLIDLGMLTAKTMTDGALNRQEERFGAMGNDIQLPGMSPFELEISKGLLKMLLPRVEESKLIFEQSGETLSFSEALVLGGGYAAVVAAIQAQEVGRHHAERFQREQQLQFEQRFNQHQETPGFGEEVPGNELPLHRE